MLVMLTSLLCAKGDVGGNLVRHRDLLTEGRDRDCDLVLFPEMSLTGYSPAAAVPLTHPAVLRLVRETLDGPAVSFGVVEQDRAGGLPFITQLVASHGKVVAVHRKEHLGDGEDGVFQAGAGAGIFEVTGTACTVAICAEIGTEPPYALGPASYSAPRRQDCTAIGDSPTATGSAGSNGGVAVSQTTRRGCFVWTRCSWCRLRQEPP